MNATTMRHLLPPLACAALAAFAPAQQSAEELAIWSDPRFKQRYIEGYAAGHEVEPKLTKDETRLVAEVYELMAADRLADAAARIREELTPASSAALDYLLARIAFQNDEVEAAAAGLKAAVEKFPRFQRAWRDLGMAYARAGDYANAVPALTRVLEFGEADAFVYGLVGYGYWTLGNHVASESAYRMANLLDPLSAQWKVGLAQSLFEQRRFDDAAAMCAILIAERPDQPDWWLLQAKAYVSLQQPGRAAQNLEILGGMGRATPETLALLGDIYINDSLFTVAAARHARALELAGTGGLARALRAAKDLLDREAYAEARMLADAVESGYSEQLAEPDRIALLRMRATLAVAAGADGEEARVLEEIVKLDPTDGRALILLAKHAGRTGQVERAEFWFERAEKLEPYEAEAKLGHGQLLANEGRYAEALPLLRRVMEIAPSESVRNYLDQVERFANRRSS